MNADPTQGAWEGNLLSNHRQGSIGPSPSDKANIAGNIYSCRTSLMTGVGKPYRLRPSYVLANPNTTFAQDAHVMIPNEERAIGPNGQLLGNVRWKLVYTKVVHNRLQFAIAILGTKDASVIHCDVAKADIERTAALASVTGEACVGMSA